VVWFVCLELHARYDVFMLCYLVFCVIGCDIVQVSSCMGPADLAIGQLFGVQSQLGIAMGCLAPNTLDGSLILLTSSQIVVS
jgi:hypothetical protein